MKSTSENREEKFAMIKRWKSGGLRQKSFCMQEGIASHHFNYGFKRFRVVYDLAPSTGKFIKLKSPVMETSDGIYAEIIFGNGNSIRFHRQVSAQELKQLAS